MTVQLYPSFGDALPSIRSIVAVVTKQEVPSKQKLAKDIWITQGFCQGSVLGEPVSVASAKELPTQDPGVIDDREAVQLLQALATDSSPPTSLSVSLKSMNASAFVASGLLTDRLAQLLLPILQKWMSDLLSNKLDDLLNRITQ